LNRWLKDDSTQILRMKDQLIAITGFMASGKTTVARALAARLACKFVDLDELIAAQQQKTITEIIETGGEDLFRLMETKALAEVLQGSDTRVIALGGGTWTIADNHRLLQRQNAFVVWLDAPFELCWQRIEAEGEGRPLASSRDQAHRLYLERRPVYALAQERIICDGKDAAEIVKEVAACLPREA
jgi:shikimate kinase